MGSLNHMSEHNPKLQIAWDSSSLGEIMFCPRKYQYTHLEGWQGDNVNLVFGGFAATGFETYQKTRLMGHSKDEAMLVVVQKIMTLSWRDGDPWGGRYENQWHCTGTEKYKNKNGNAAKCPYSHKGMWFPEPAPIQCGECGSPVSTERNYIPVHTSKNRIGLIRMLVWYMDEQPEVLTDGLHPYVFPNGTPAVELSSRLPLPYHTPYGEQYLLTQHLDYIGVFGGELWTVDNKTTTQTLGPKFWEGYSPHYQMDTYDLTGTVLFPELELRGVMVDGAQVLKDGARFARHPFYKTEGQREEHWATIEYWIKQAEAMAMNGYWPMNKRNCWLCDFKNICNKDPGERERYLKADFTQGPVWNPLEER